MAEFQSRDIPISDREPQHTTDIPLEDMVEFSDNPEPRCPCVLILDTSGSMAGLPIESLNEGVRTFKKELQMDTLASLRVEVASITYEGGFFKNRALISQDFITADKFDPPELKAQWGNYEADAIHIALDMIEVRKRQYRNSGISYYLPWVIMICDGKLTDPQVKIDSASQRLRKAEQDKQVAFFAIGVEGADMEQLAQLGSRTPLLLKGLAFNELFIWLSSSMSRVSSSRPGDEVRLDLDGLKSWAAL